MEPLLITGVHRSGTSWVARALHEAGAHLGDDLLADDAGNPYGHFEDVSVIALHDDALREQQLTWKSTVPIERPTSSELHAGIAAIVDERRALGRPWAIKDPRLCLFLPEWIEAAPLARVIVVFRRPDEVVRSLHRRHSERWVATRHVDPSDVAFWKEPDLAIRLWIHYNEQLLDTVQRLDPHQVHVVDWNNIEASADVVAATSHKWDLGLTPTGLTRDRTLGRSAPQSCEVRDTSLIGRARSTWEQLHELAHTR